MLQQAFEQTRQNARLWRNLYLVSLISALLLLILPAAQLLDVTTFTTIQDAADGADLWHLLELMLSGDIDAALGREQLQTLSEVLQATTRNVAIGIVSASFLLSAYLRGGTYARLWGRPRAFHPAARRFVFSMFGMQIAHFVLIVATIFAAITIGGVLGDPSLTLPITYVVLAVLIFWIVLFELATAALVRHETRNPLRGMSQAVRTIFRRPLALLGFYGVAFVGMAAFQWVFRFWIHPNLPSTWWLLVLLVQQVSIFGRIGLRIFRFAGALDLVTPPVRTDSTDGANDSGRRH